MGKILLKKDGTPRKPAGRPKGSTRTTINTGYTDKYGGMSIADTTVPIDELRYGMKKAIKKKYGGMSIWYASILRLAEGNPYMTKVVLDMLFLDKFKQEPKEEPKKDVNEQNVIKLGFSSAENDSLTA